MLSTMSSTELASQEQQESIKQAEQEALEHSILVKTTIPRAKITHKGLQDIEDVNEDSAVAKQRERELELADQERERIERKLTGLDREVSRLIDAYQAEVIEISELSERRRRGEEQGRMLRQRLREMVQQRANRENEVRLLEGVEAFCASVRQSLEEPSFEVKQKVLQLVVDRIVVEESRVVIQHVVPTGAVRLSLARNSGLQ